MSRERAVNLMVASSALVLLLAGCSDDAADPCDTYIQVGGSCPYEGLTCPSPTSSCGLTCTCVDEPGGFAWDCQHALCSCTCPCGKIATTSCELTDCENRRESPCPPAVVQGSCTAACYEPDAGPDAAADATSDTAGDVGQDAPPDVAPDAPADLVADAPADMAPDAPADFTAAEGGAVDAPAGADAPAGDAALQDAVSSSQ